MSYLYKFKVPSNNSNLYKILIRNGLYYVKNYAPIEIIVEEISLNVLFNEICRKILLIPFTSEGIVKINFEGTTLNVNDFVCENTAPYLNDVIVHSAKKFRFKATCKIGVGLTKDHAKFNNWYNISLKDELISAESDIEYSIEDLRSALLKQFQ